MTKKFIDEKATFEIEVPFTWKYFLKDGKIHTFQDYVLWKSDAFQLSITPFKDEGQKNNFISQLRQLKKVNADGVSCFAYADSNDGEFTVKAWTLLLNERRVLFTFTTPNSVDPELDNRSMEEKEKIALECIKSFRLIEDAEREVKLNSYRFDMFIQGISATALILNKAVENRAFIEATCILANQIDALLRIGIVLRNQIADNNSDVELEWIYQGLADRKKSEKDVYKKAKDLGIIDESVFEKLYVLYDDRNRVIHRFIISEITLAEVEQIAYKYHQIRTKVNSIIYDIETEQIRKNVGMTRNSSDQEVTEYMDYIKGKIGKQNYFENRK